ncbi:MAG: hypothetical protein Kow0025_15550 [Thermodesulfovibrionales bacterium]
MDRRVYGKYEEIFSRLNVAGRVLEIGALPSRKSLLASGRLKAATEKVGLNLEGPQAFEDFKILKGDANDMAMFRDGYFDCVLCNAVLEHDRHFWKSLSEMRRVLAPGGLLVLGAPSFRDLLPRGAAKLARGRNRLSSLLRNGAVCYRIHNAPGDYYRFSEQAFREVFFEGFRDVVVETMLTPPRTIAYGFRQ